MDDWIEDSRFDTLVKRRDIRGMVNERISGVTRDKSMNELVDLFTQHQVPHAPILGVKEALSQPQAAAREMVVEADHQVLGKIPIVNRSIKFPGDHQPVPTAPPVLGQHTNEILRDILGLTSEQNEELLSSKVVA
jgi:formyl-CoA transferase/CoA:oxalate CoA-transferase